MRVLGCFLLFVSALSAPFWFFVIVVIAYALCVRAPHEILGIALILDVVFGSSEVDFWYTYTFVTCIVYLLCTFLRPYAVFDSYV